MIQFAKAITSLCGGVLASSLYLYMRADSKWSQRCVMDFELLDSVMLLFFPTSNVAKG